MSKRPSLGVVGAGGHEIFNISCQVWFLLVQYSFCESVNNFYVIDDGCQPIVKGPPRDSGELIHNNHNIFYC